MAFLLVILCAASSTRCFIRSVRLSELPLWQFCEWYDSAESEAPIRCKTSANAFLVDSRVLRPQWCTTLYTSCCKRNPANRCCDVYVFHLPPKRLSWALKTQPQQPRLHTTLAVVPEALDICGLFNVSRVSPLSGLIIYSTFATQRIRFNSQALPKSTIWGIAVDGMLHSTSRHGQKVAFRSSAYVHICTNTFSEYAKDQTQPNQPTNKSLFPRCSVRCTPLCSDWATGRRGSDGLRTWTEPMSRQRILLQPPSAKTARSSSRLEGRLGKDGREPQF